ncbi:MAG: hypothetical protein AAB662_01740 [Patescibacteria group bacterium]
MHKVGLVYVLFGQSATRILISNPSASFIERPDFIINAPRLIQFGRPIWKEVAPEGM